MAIIFKEEGHVYESSDQDKINWTSVTSFIGKFKPKFDAKGQAKKSAKNKISNMVLIMSKSELYFKSMILTIKQPLTVRNLNF